MQGLFSLHCLVFLTDFSHFYLVLSSTQKLMLSQRTIPRVKFDSHIIRSYLN
ncbi:SanA protein, partial [Vibrio crassostreae]